MTCPGQDCTAKLGPDWVAWCPICGEVEPMGPRDTRAELDARAGDRDSRSESARTNVLRGDFGLGSNRAGRGWSGR